ncbi:MAG: hypothetical protein ACRD4I_01630, partial [Candidatus Angelobacter sp.]
NSPVTYDQTKPFAKATARLLEARHPRQVLSDMKKALRVGKVFVDWSQNDDYKTTVCAYSLRAKDQPTVATPVRWKEVENCLKKENPALLSFTSDQVLARVQKQGDLFQPVLTLKQELPEMEQLWLLEPSSPRAAEHAAKRKSATKTRAVTPARARSARPRKKLKAG